MPPVHPKSLQGEAITEATTSSQNSGPSLPEYIDLFDMITDIVAKTKSRSESKVKPKKKIEDPCGICEKNVLPKIKNRFNVILVDFGSINLVRV